MDSKQTWGFQQQPLAEANSEIWQAKFQGFEQLTSGVNSTSIWLEKVSAIVGPISNSVAKQLPILAA